MRSDLESKQKSIDASIKNKDAKIETLTEKIVSLEEENQFLRRDVEHKSIDCDTVQNDKSIADMQCKLESSDNRILALENELVQKKRAIHDQEENNMKSEKAIETLTQYKLDSEQRIIERENVIEKQRLEIETMVANIEKQKFGLEDIKSQKDSIENTLALKNEEISNLLENVEQLSKHHSEQVEAEENLLRENENTLKQLEEQLSTVTLQHQQMELSYQQIGEDLEEKNCLIVQLEEKLQGLQDQNVILEQSVKGKDDEVKLLKDHNKSIKGSLSDVKERNYTLEAKETANQQLIKELEDTCRRVQLEMDQNTIGVENCEKMKKEYEELYTLNSTLENNIQDLKKDLAGVRNKNAQAEEDLECSEATITELSQQIEHLKMEFSRTKEAKETLSFELTEKETLYESEICKLKSILTEHENSIQSLKEDLDDANKHNVSSEDEKSRTSELLSEMNSMNLELKKRGERVNLLQEEKEKLRGDVASVNQKLKHAEDKISKLSDENRTLSPQAIADDTMSSSTISKAEQDTRMADIEATFEDRYSKLKLVAIKLKKKNVELEKQISDMGITGGGKNAENTTTESRSANSDPGPGAKTQNITSTQKDKLSKAVKNLENLQTEYDAAQDTIEEQKSIISTMKKDIESSVSECISVKEKLVSVQSDVDIKDNKLTDALSKIDTLTKDVHLVNELKSENLKLSEDLRSCKSKLDRLTGTEKRHDLLDLELEEAEARIKQLTVSDEEAKNEIISLKEELSREIDVRKNRDDQIKEIEETLTKEEQRSEELKTKLSESRNVISQHEIGMVELQAEMDIIKKDLNIVRNEKDKLACQLADISGSAVSSAQAFTQKNESLQKMVSVLETDVCRKKSRIEELEERLATVEKDYDSYKVRAQSVLRQQQQPTKEETDSNDSQPNPDSNVVFSSASIQDQLKEKVQEINSLERVIENLNQRITEISTRLAALTMESNHLNEDHDRLMERHSTLLQEMASKEKAARDKHDQLLKLANQAERARQDAVANLQQETEALRQTYRSQIESLQMGHGNEVLKMQKQIDDLENNIIRLQIQNSTRQEDPNNSNDAGALEREAAEGSEATDPPQRPSSGGVKYQSTRNNLLNSNRHKSPSSPPLMKNGSPESNLAYQNNKPVPLDRLLSQADDDFNDEGSSDRYNVVSPSSQGPDRDRMSISELTHRASELNDDKFVPTSLLEEVKHQLISAEKKSTHLSSLLSESESENVRLNQLSSVLKEEIRTYRRSEERSKHIENLEYVKNIIVKFVTMPGSDEKARLIPVLSTILKLSPAEIETIQKTVNIDAEEQVAQDAGGWSSYLGRWT